MLPALLPLVLACTLSSDPRKELRDYLEACERFGFSGSVLVSRKGKVLLADGFGLADRERGVRNASDTCFEIASATKPITALAVVQLAELGKLDLDDSIAEHLPGVPEEMRDVTVRHLLMHTSGMPRAATGGHGDDLERAVAGFLSTPPVREPGEQHEYWNGGYALLAGIVERASGESYVDWCHRHVFEPAKMKSSGFTGDALFESAPVAIGYETGQAPRRADEHPYGSYGWHYRGMGGMVTTVEDLLRFHQALRDDTLLTKEWRETLLAPGLGKYACGFWVLDEPRPVITHGGDVRGFHSKFSFYPEDDAAIVVLCNVSGVPTWAVTENLQAILFGDPSRYPSPPRTEGWKPAELEAFAGTYVGEGEEGVVVSVDGESLVIEPLGIETTLFLWRPEGPSFGREPAAPDPDLVALGREILEAVASRDPEPLRRAMQERIPRTWPDEVVTVRWPEIVKDRGKLESVRLASGYSLGDSTILLFALEHAKGESRTRIVFQGDRLGIFDLKASGALASMRVVPESRDRLVGFAWTGEQPEPIEVRRDGKKRVRALRIPGRGGEREYARE